MQPNENESHTQDADSEVRKIFSVLLDELCGNPHCIPVCKGCGLMMTLFEATFFFETADRSWNIPLPVCLNCNPSFQMTSHLPKAA
jgi:hypothetical protein